MKAPVGFSKQYLACRDDGMVGYSEGPEFEMDMAFPNEKFLAYVKEHGRKPVFRHSACRRFGGICSSGNPGCRALRGWVDGQ